MIQTQPFRTYSKLKTIYKSPVGKVQVVLYQDEQSDSENLNPNKQINQSNQLMILKKYSRSLSQRLGVNTINEFTILKEIKHQNIISFGQVFEQKDANSSEVCMTMELMAPLQNMLDGLDAVDIQYIFSQIVKGLFFVHSNNILHRDIKPSNILISEQGICKLSDFGIARKYEQHMTGNTCTKPPQIFLGQVNYGYEIDIWGLGCTLAEMFIKQTLFDGLRETEILSKIADLLGDINETSLGDVSKLKLYFEITAHKNQPKLKDILKGFNVPSEVQEMIISMLNLNPNNRPTIQDIIQSPYVINAPLESLKVQKLAQEWIYKTKNQFLKKK